MDKRLTSVSIYVYSVLEYWHRIRSYSEAYLHPFHLQLFAMDNGQFKERTV